MMNLHWLKLGVFVVLGALGGFAYYAFIGCTSGTCPITSNPYISTGYGALMGAVLGWERKQNSSQA
ncbi:MAG: hypothetical protein D0433_11930 [Candidatus Thermochlorobacter aerophilum]|jgi:hypothetical protein|uniref:YtxH domain-containing protein n=1 Tax=Candidatus Thermochlorobacter aerophilus TaxID=1868324 RepID=A0A395LX78_9BACT|nr:MAG: hypothetical protein D0433_11930 [Candidatus Thermochlorobacter aerophilum]